MEQFGLLTLGSRLKRLSDFLFIEVQNIYQACGVPISATYFPILRQLQTVGAASVVELSESLGVSHPAVSKQIAKMQKEGLVEKVVDPNDQRRTSLSLSAHGKGAMAKAEPVLHELKIVIDQMASFSSENFEQAFDQFESNSLGSGLAENVLDRIQPLEIIEYEEKHQSDFLKLHMRWLNQHFPNQICEYDRAVLNDPIGNILNKNGRVWLAVRKTEKGDRIIGSVSVLPRENVKTWEMMKLAVVAHCQGLGVAQRLIDVMFQEAVKLEISKVVLETAVTLEAAGRLYRKNGFVVKPFPKASYYGRSDVYMEKEMREEVV